MRKFVALFALATCGQVWCQGDAVRFVSTSVYSGEMDKGFVHRQPYNEFLRVRLPPAVAQKMPRSGFVRIFEMRSKRDDLLETKGRPKGKENCIWYSTEGRFAAHVTGNVLTVEVITGRSYLGKLDSGLYASKDFLMVMEGRDILPSYGGFWIDASSVPAYFGSGISMTVEAPPEPLRDYAYSGGGWGSGGGGGSQSMPTQPISTFIRECLKVEGRPVTGSPLPNSLIARFDACDAGPTTVDF